MKKQANTLLSEELQELYLENKEWLSDIAFLEDESHFLRNLFGESFSGAANNLKQMEKLNDQLIKLGDHRLLLKKLVLQHKDLIENILKDPNNAMNMSLIEENEKISSGIRTLFKEDRQVKKDLFDLVEGLKKKPGLLLGK